MMEKIFDLRKEIKNEKERKGLNVDLTDLNLKKQIGENRLDLVTNKVAKKIIEPFLEWTEDLPFDERVKKIENFIGNDENIKINIQKAEHEKDLINSVYHHRNGSKNPRYYKEEGSIRVHYADRNGNYAEEPILTNLDCPLTDGGTKSWKLRGDSSSGKPVKDRTKLFAEIYLANALYEYTEDEDRRNFILLKAIDTRYKWSSDTIALSKEEHDRLTEETKKLKYSFSRELKIVEDKGSDVYSKLISYFDYSSLFNLAFSFDSTTVKEGKVSIRLKALNYGENIITKEALSMMFEESGEIENEMKNIKKQASSYAGATDIKKNIPAATTDAMKSSRFNEYYGYVQYDEDVDLTKAKKIEKEFLDFSKFFRLSPNKKASLGFRRLGKYSSKYMTVRGMYFPLENYVVIDIKSPSSFIHEMMHMLDHQLLPYGKISDSFRFRSIKKEYLRIVGKEIMSRPKDDPQRVAWEVKNQSEYYSDTREVFARCGETYIKKVLGFDSSLIYQDGDIYHPEEKDFLKLLKNYFEEIFGEKRDFEERETKTVASANFVAVNIDFDNPPYKGEQMMLKLE